MSKLEITYIPLKDLTPDPGNAKQHTSQQVNRIAESLVNYGFNQPLGVWHNPQGQLIIVAGHGRYLAAQSLGLETVPCVLLDHLSDAERKAYALVDNKTSLETPFDPAKLSAQLDELAAMSVNLEDFGFDESLFSTMGEQVQDSEGHGAHDPEDDPDGTHVLITCETHTEALSLATSLTDAGYHARVQ